MNAVNHLTLPADLPVPLDDGAARHLPGMRMPAIALPATDGRRIDLSKLTAPRNVIYAYPRTGAPGQPVPPEWDMVPGARGCTPQSCSFRDLHRELTALGAEIFGLSTQTTEYQREMAERNHLPFAVLSDAQFALTEALRLPTFTFEGVRLLKRLTLILRAGSIEAALYPVFPPDRSAADTLAWLQAHPL
jgi:peroxiredoxin